MLYTEDVGGPGQAPTKPSFSVPHLECGVVVSAFGLFLTDKKIDTLIFSDRFSTYSALIPSYLVIP
jgi:hypothetical protein